MLKGRFTENFKSLSSQARANGRCSFVDHKKSSGASQQNSVATTGADGDFLNVKQKQPAPQKVAVWIHFVFFSLSFFCLSSEIQVCGSPRDSKLI